LNVNPYDISETADAYYNATIMNPDDKKRRSKGFKDIIYKRNIFHWINDQFMDIEKLMVE
jgi:trehalose-6-phosphate synthase